MQPEIEIYVAFRTHKLRTSNSEHVLCIRKNSKKSQAIFIFCKAVLESLIFLT